jgi:uncharacterized membrane protein
MKPQTLSRRLTIAHSYIVSKASIGKEAYRAKRSQCFDRALVQTARTPLGALLANIVVFGTMIAFYKLVAQIVATQFAPAAPAQENQQLRQSF